MSIYRTEFMRGEKTAAMVWLSLGAIISVLIEVIYLGSRITIADYSIPFPWTIVAALLFNMVLTRTASLWSTRLSWRLIPLAAWTIAFFILLFWPTFATDQLLGINMRTILLLTAGIVGGLWPLRSTK